MSDHTHSDKPDLPALPKPSEKGWIYEAKQMKAYGRQCADEREAWARADERRKALESAIAECDRMYEHRAVNGFAREASTARALANKLRSWIDRREPTT